ncbi:MAG: YaiI/YqxD family protein [Proteobacteria bacterium]|nr:YaiI/YqxD family protein [Pseudomonadota bacterium]
MKIWIDGDGTPAPVKEIVFRASTRLAIEVVMVANRQQKIPRSKLISLVQVKSGFDVADDYIVANCAAGDLIITGDIPLAAEVVEKGGVVLEHRGEFIDADNARQKLAMRDFMHEMREGGLLSGGGPPPFGPTDRQCFANALDRFLTSQRR